MVDELYDRAYQQSRTELHLGIARMLGGGMAAIRTAFAVLNRIEYDAPWASKKNKVGRA